jgi:hypothetical protein
MAARDVETVRNSNVAGLPDLPETQDPKAAALKLVVSRMVANVSTATTVGSRAHRYDMNSIANDTQAHPNAVGMNVNNSQSSAAVISIASDLPVRRDAMALSVNAMRAAQNGTSNGIDMPVLLAAGERIANVSPDRPSIVASTAAVLPIHHSMQAWPTDDLMAHLADITLARRCMAIATTVTEVGALKARRPVMPHYAIETKDAAIADQMARHVAKVHVRAMAPGASIVLTRTVPRNHPVPL